MTSNNLNPRKHRGDDAASIVVFLLLISLVLGGGTRTFLTADVLVEAISIPFLVVALVKITAVPKPVILVAALVVASLGALLPLVQLVPLPPNVWSALSGRAAVADAFRLANVELPWLGVSLSPSSTRQGFLSLAPALAVFVWTVQTDWSGRRFAVAAIAAFGLISVAVEVLQLTLGLGNLLRVLDWAETDNASAFFANRNHLAALLYCVVLLSGTMGVSIMMSGASNRVGISDAEIPFRIGAFLIAFGACLFGIVLTNSRAGLALGILAACFALGQTALYSRSNRRRRSPWLIISSIAGVCIVLGLNYTFLDFTRHFSGGIADATRDAVARQTLALAARYFPVGAGFGTFERIYAGAETPITSMSAAINRAHNDFLEWTLEGGAGSIALVVLAIIWLAWANLRSWIAKAVISSSDRALSRACAAIPVLLLIHSAVDYPLRTISIMTIMGFCTAACMSPALRLSK